jgi:hypothetical protein
MEFALLGWCCKLSGIYLNFGEDLSLLLIRAFAGMTTNETSACGRTCDSLRTWNRRDTRSLGASRLLSSTDA